MPALAVCCPFLALRALSRGDELRAFLCSATLIASLLLGTAGVLYPVLLPSTIDPAFDLDAMAAASSNRGLALGLAWWLPSMALAVLYFANLFRSIRGKVEATGHGH